MNSALFTSKKDDWSTPQRYLDIYQPTWDPCPLGGGGLWDGLKIKWHGSILLNPPFSNQREWVEKAIAEVPNCQSIILLLPARTDTKLFHDLIYNKYMIKFIKGRLKFGGSKNSAPFPSMLVYLNHKL